MEIKDRIAKLGQYFGEMKVATVKGTQLIIVKVAFPQNWMIDSDIQDKFDVNVVPDGENGYLFVTQIENGENVVFDAIDYCVTQMQNAIERANLLRTKVEELKKLFEDDNVTLEELKSLSFSYNTSTDNVCTPAPVEEITPLVVSKKKDSKKKKNDE